MPKGTKKQERSRHTGSNTPQDKGKKRKRNQHDTQETQPAASRRARQANGTGEVKSKKEVHGEATDPPRTHAKRSRRRGSVKEAEAPVTETSPPQSAPQHLLDRAALIAKVLDSLFPTPPIPLNFTDNFTFLCAVLLSAQSTDGKVNQVTSELFKVAPTAEKLSKMSHQAVVNIIQSVGLAPTKAKHLIAMSAQLVSRFGGKVPGSFKELESLPGVGHKTASVVMSQAFGALAFAVDTHIHRLALRWGLSKSEKNVLRAEEDLKAVFPPELWAKVHLQIIYFGREYCPAKGHEAGECPICSWVNKTGEAAPKSLADIAKMTGHTLSGSALST
ncbi:unnamed protein product, partial [Discosporangium mesarthrocarpum]